MKKLKNIFTALLCLMLLSTTLFSLKVEKVKAIEDFTTIIDDFDVGTGLNKIEYSEGWGKGSNDASFHNGTYSYAQLQVANNNKTKSFKVTFYGKKVELYGSKRSWYGKYKIRIDEGESMIVDANSKDDKLQTLVFESETLEEKEHILYFEFCMEQNEGDAIYEANLDYIKVFRSAVEATDIQINEGNMNLALGDTKQLTTTISPLDASNQDVVWSVSDNSIAQIDQKGLLISKGKGQVEVTASIKNTKIQSSIIVEIAGNEFGDYLYRINDMDEGNGMFQVTYDGIWGTDKGYPDLYYLGDSHWSNSLKFGDTWPSYTIKFYGTKIELYGNKDETNGIYDIAVDGGEPVKVDIYQEGQRVQKQKIYESEVLINKEHTIQVSLTKDKHPGIEHLSHEMTFDSAVIYHNEINAKKVSFEEDKIFLEEGMKKKLQPIIYPIFATTQAVNYSVQDENIAVVDKGGYIIGKNEGKTTLTTRINKTNITCKTDVEVVKERGNLRATVTDTDRHYQESDYDDLILDIDNDWFAAAWKNDKLNSEFVITTLSKDVKNVSIDISEFRSENGDVFASKNISAKFLKETSAYVGHGAQAGGAANQPHMNVPDIIFKDEVLDIKAKKVQPVWVEIAIPENTKPGIYNGNIKVKGDGEIAIMLAYSFEVLDISVPKPDDYKYTMELWEYPYAVSDYYGIKREDAFNDRHLDLLKESLRDYQEVGGSVMTTIILDCDWGRFNPLANDNTIGWYREKNGDLSYDYTNFDKWVKLNEEMGIADKIKLFSVSSDWVWVTDKETGEKVKLSIPIGSEAWKKFWSNFLQDFIPHLIEKGWVDKTYFSVDEISEAQIIDFLDLLDDNKVDEKRIKFSAAVNYGHMSQETMNRIDDISIGLIYISNENKEAENLAQARREKGLATSFYTCVGHYPNSFALSDPAESAWTIWYNVSIGLDGYLRWAYNNWLTTPYETLDWLYWEAGDTMMVYPDPNRNAENPITYSTPRMEKMKEAKRDVEKLNYLTTNDPSLKEEADTLLSSMGRRYGYTNAYGGVYASSEEDKEFIIQEVNRMKNGLNALSKKYIDNQKLEVDKSELQEEMKKAEKIDVNSYTTSSYKNVKVAYDKATDVYQNEAANQIEVSDATMALKEAISLLELRADTTTLVDAIKKGEDLKPYAYTSDTWAVYQIALNNAKAAVKDNSNVSETQAALLLEHLVTAYMGLREETTLAKTILKSAIEKASTAEMSEAFKTLAPSVQTLVRTTRNAALLVYNDVNATRIQCMDTWMKLANALHFLEFQADKAALGNLIKACSEIHTEDYHEGVEEFKAALADAQTVFKNVNTLQASIDEAYENLDIARSGLVKNESGVDKLLLESMISYFESQVGNGEKYKQDHESWTAYVTAVAEAKAIMEDEAATQNEVNTTLKKLTAAYENIRLLPSEEALAELVGYLGAVHGINRNYYTKAQLKLIDETTAKVKKMLEDFDGNKFPSLRKEMAVALKVINDVTVKNPNNVDNLVNVTHPNTGDNYQVNSILLTLMLSGFTIMLIGRKHRRKA